MSIEELQTYCLQKKGTTTDFPFDEVTMVIKVGDKIFILISLDKNPININLKCDPFFAEVLREKYKAVTPGYHMNKRHWNTIVMDDTIPDKLVKSMIDDSYNLVFTKLPKKNKNIFMQN